MATLLWVVLPVLIALGSSLMAVYIMQQRMEVQLARERQSLSEARATIEAQKSTLDELHRLRGEEVRRKALDEFLADLRTEERHFIREQKMLFASRKSLVMQERVYFRNIPLCNWVEHEVPLQEGADVESLVKTVSVFAPELIGSALNGSPKTITSKKIGVLP
jgi:cell division protein FtsB